MNHWPEYIDIWHGASLRQGDSTVFTEDTNCPIPRT